LTRTKPPQAKRRVPRRSLDGARLQLRIADLICFYDHREDENSKHAAAVTGVLGEELALATFGHFMEARRRNFSLVSTTCGPGKPKGRRLDAWLQVGRRPVALYQTEVKNWSAHSFGGKPLNIDASRSEIRQYKKERWKHEFQNDRLVSPLTRKVLLLMSPPSASLGAKIRPLLIYWFAVHPRGEDKPFFSVRVRAKHFERLWVFSVSAYLRRLRSRTITLTMPLAKRRLALLHTIVASAG